MRRVLVAPNTLKGTMTAVQFVEAIQTHQALLSGAIGIIPDDLETDPAPVADGGDGLLSCLFHHHSGWQSLPVTVCGPFPAEKITATPACRPDSHTVVIESAQANGLALCERLNPLSATSYGVGELIQTALTHCPDTRQLVVGLGGSASTDGGLGALQALGLKISDSTGRLIQAPVGGGDLASIQTLNWDFMNNWPDGLEILLAADVTNPLLGPTGTARVYAPQKGATPADCDLLEAGIQHFAALCGQTTGKNHTQMAGAGAAGGLGFGLSHLPNIRLVSGFGWLADTLDLHQRIQHADLILTAEGRVDATSLQGKAVGELIKLAAGKPVWLFCGSVAAGTEARLPENVRLLPFEAVLSREAAMASPAEAIRRMLQAIIATR